jgi:hypothetical protein
MIQLMQRSPDKKRLVAALRFEPHPEIPFFETEFSPSMVGKILGNGANVRSYLLPPKDLVRFLELTGIDAAYKCYGWSPGRVEKVISDGRSIYIDGCIKSKSDLKGIRAPGLDPMKRMIEDYYNAASGTDLGLVIALPNPEDIASSIGYTDFYTFLYEDPDFIREFLDIQDEFSFRVIDLALQYKPDAVFMASSLCYKTGMVMSMELAEEFIFPRIRKRTGMVNQAGIPAIIHSDGDNSAMMDKWIELGFQGFHPVETGSHFDIFNVKKKWGDKIALLGNIDILTSLSTSSMEETREDVLHHLNILSEGGGYICGSSHDIDDNVKLENLKVMAETIGSFRRKDPTMA